MDIATLAEHWDETVVPYPERNPETPHQHAWADTGIVIAPGLAPEHLMAAYETEWLTHNGGPDAQPGTPSTYRSAMGWQYATPYVDHPALRALACCGEIADLLTELTGEPMGVHLNLTGWQSTRRNWHFDQYLNEPYVGGFYAAVWLALDDIHPDAGPFQYVPASNTWWPPISQAKMRTALGSDGNGPDWPTHSERILTPPFEAELAARNVSPTEFIASRGDVLVWHGRLLHRGSTPKDPNRERRGVIMHYSGIHHRPDMPPAVQHELGGWYFPLQGRQPMEYPR